MIEAETTLSCQHCAARYTVVVVHLRHPEHGAARCQACDKVMASWRGANRPVFRRIPKPVAA